MLKEVFGSHKPVIAMAHFPPLPGTSLYDANKGMDGIVEYVARDLKAQLEKYVEFAKGHGFYAEARSEVGTDAITVLDRLAAGTARDYPSTMFFAGKLVFKEEDLISRFLHNQTSFLVQKKLVYQGLPMIILPIRAM